MHCSGLESQSKRTSAAKRYKIERKVAEHDRKQRKETKASGKMRSKYIINLYTSWSYNNPDQHWSSAFSHPQELKKDPGIPNLWSDSNIVC